MNVLIEKLSHKRVPSIPGQLRWLFDGLLGQPWVIDTPIGQQQALQICITSDGHVTAGNTGSELVVGEALDLEWGLSNVCRAVGLTQAELCEFGRLYRLRVTDHRCPKDRSKNHALVR